MRVFLGPFGLTSARFKCSTSPSRYLTVCLLQWPQGKEAEAEVRRKEETRTARRYDHTSALAAQRLIGRCMQAAGMREWRAAGRHAGWSSRQCACSCMPMQAASARLLLLYTRASSSAHPSL